MTCEPRSEQQSSGKHRMCILEGPTIMKTLRKVLSHLEAEGRTVGKGCESKRRLEERFPRGQDLAGLGWGFRFKAKCL